MKVRGLTGAMLRFLYPSCVRKTFSLGSPDAKVLLFLISRTLRLCEYVSLSVIFVLVACVSSSFLFLFLYSSFVVPGFVGFTILVVRGVCVLPFLPSVVFYVWICAI